MTITRILPAVLLAAAATTGPVLGQFQTPPYSPGRPASVVPSIAPGENQYPTPPPRDSTAESLNRLTAPQLPGGAVPSDPVAAVGTLMAPPGLPAGSYGSPWYSDGPGCCGPVGRHGPVSYDIYFSTGPSLPFGSGAFTDRLHLGWLVGGGGRSLFFNQAGDAAWAVDLGLNYIYNRGSNDDFLNVFTRTPPLTGANNRAIPQPDVFQTVRIRGLSRTAFNFAVGRDWFLWGNAMPGGEDGWNFRVGADVGGRWGTAHVDMVPLDDPTGYSRRQKVFHGLFFDFHSNLEVPVGAWIFFAGTRVQWGYDWMNIVPPLKGDVQNVNLLLTTGFRY
jgi:hypothetical protein